MLLDILAIAIPFLLVVCFAIGAFFSFRLNFMPGALFFFILLVNKILQFYFQDYISNLQEQELSLPQDMSIGAFVAAFQNFSNIFEMIAFIILLVGLYRKWKKRQYPMTKVEELRPKE